VTRGAEAATEEATFCDNLLVAPQAMPMARMLIARRMWTACAAPIGKRWYAG